MWDLQLLFVFLSFHELPSKKWYIQREPKWMQKALIWCLALPTQKDIVKWYLCEPGSEASSIWKVQVICACFLSQQIYVKYISDFFYDFPSHGIYYSNPRSKKNGLPEWDWEVLRINCGQDCKLDKVLQIFLVSVAPGK